MNFPRILTLCLCATLGACANLGKNSPENRATIHTVRLVNPTKGAKADYYMDRTATASQVAGLPFGSAGAAVGRGIATLDVQSGQTRWTPITKGHEARALQFVRENVEKEFLLSGKLRCQTNDAPDAQLIFTRISYGVTQNGGMGFKVIIIAEAEMKTLDGATIWKTTSSGMSSASLPREQYRQDPKAFSSGLEVAAQNLAAKLVAAY